MALALLAECINYVVHMHLINLKINNEHIIQ